MARCDVCGNEYDRPFFIEMNGERYTFDAFECAIHKLAPACEHCGCRVIGHGVEQAGAIFCCASCARQRGKHELRDRSEAPAPAAP